MKKLLFLVLLPLMALGLITTGSLYANPMDNIPKNIGKNLVNYSSQQFNYDDVDYTENIGFYTLKLGGDSALPQPTSQWDEIVKFSVIPEYSVSIFRRGKEFSNYTSGVTFKYEPANDYEWRIYANDNLLFTDLDATTEIRIYKIANHSNLVPLISNSHSVLNDIDKPYTLDEIKQLANVTALDEYYGDLTNSVTVTEDTYTANKNKVGTYRLTFSVTNPSGLTATSTLNVINRDIKVPTITGPSTSSVSYKTTVTNAEILAKYTVTDNYDSSVELVVENTNYVAGQVGTFTFNLVATDSSGNTARATHTLVAFDDVKPAITDEHIDPIELSWKQDYTQADLLIGLTASDEVDGNITDKITIKSSNFQNKIVGTYTVVYEATDAAGNSVEHTRTYKVITTDNPVFYVSKNVLLIEDINLMTIDQIIAEIARYEDLRIASYTILHDEFSGNEQTVGTYNFEFSARLNSGETVELSRSVRVFNLATEQPDYPEPSTLESIGQWIYNFILKPIANFFIFLANLFNHVVRFFGIKWELLKYLV